MQARPRQRTGLLWAIFLIALAYVFAGAGIVNAVAGAAHGTRAVTQGALCLPGENGSDHGTPASDHEAGACCLLHGSAPGPLGPVPIVSVDPVPGAAPDKPRAGGLVPPLDRSHSPFGARGPPVRA
jgi:hypothetical protein